MTFNPVFFTIKVFLHSQKARNDKNMSIEMKNLSHTTIIWLFHAMMIPARGMKMTFFIGIHRINWKFILKKNAANTKIFLNVSKYFKYNSWFLISFSFSIFAVVCWHKDVSSKLEVCIIHSNIVLYSMKVCCILSVGSTSFVCKDWAHKNCIQTDLLRILWFGTSSVYIKCHKFTQ